jgi:hypothetical protein
MFSPLPLLRLLDEEGDLLRVKDFSFFKETVGTSSNFFQKGRKFLPDDLLTDPLMVGIKSGKILLIKKMAERAMPDIMEEPGQTKEFLHIGKRGKFCFEDLEERGIKLLRESSRDMHGPKGVLKTSMFGRRKHPTGALEMRRRR